MIPGTTVAIGGADFLVPPLSLAQLREFLPKIQQLSGVGPADMGTAQLGILVEIVTAALQRNYPDLTVETVEEMLDLGNAMPVLNAILGSLKLPAPIEAPVYEAAQGDQPTAVEAAPSSLVRYEPAYPWRPNPPVVGS